MYLYTCVRGLHIQIYMYIMYIYIYMWVYMFIYLTCTRLSYRHAVMPSEHIGPVG